MRKSVQERLFAKRKQTSVQTNPLDVTLGGGTSLTYGVGSSDYRDVGADQSIRLPKDRSGQTSKVI